MSKSAMPRSDAVRPQSSNLAVVTWKSSPEAAFNVASKRRRSRSRRRNSRLKTMSEAPSATTATNSMMS